LSGNGTWAGCGSGKGGCGDDDGRGCDDESYGGSLNDLVGHEWWDIGDAGCAESGDDGGVFGESGDKGGPDKRYKDYEGEAEDVERMLRC